MAVRSDSKIMVKWLDQEFFKTALRAGYNDPNIEVGQISLRMGTHDGDNYISSVYRSILSYRSKNRITPHIEMIVKLIAAKMSTSLPDEVPFKTEVQMYEEIVPGVEMLLQETMTPKLIYATKHPYHAIVLEDAYQNGYRMLKIRHDLENCYFIAEKLAKWHAATFFMAKTQKASNIQNFKRGIFTVENNDGFKFMLNTLDVFIDATIRWENFDPYIQKLMNFRNTLVQNTKKLYTIGRTDKFIVLNHGDLNYHNFLVKYDEEQHNLTDILFIDFQLSVFGTAAIDLYCLLYLVTTDEARASSDHIIKHYYSTFSRSLKKFGYSKDIPTLEDLNDELEKYKFLALVMAVCVMPFFYTGLVNKQEGDDKAAKFDPELRKKIFQLEDYKTFIIPFLKEYFKY